MRGHVSIQQPVLEISATEQRTDGNDMVRKRTKCRERYLTFGESTADGCMRTYALMSHDMWSETKVRFICCPHPALKSLHHNTYFRVKTTHALFNGKVMLRNVQKTQSRTARLHSCSMLILFAFIAQRGHSTTISLKSQWNYTIQEMSFLSLRRAPKSENSETSQTHNRPMPMYP